MRAKQSPGLGAWAFYADASEANLDFETLQDLTHGGTGRRDVPCPLCGPGRSNPANRKRRVLRVYRISEDFATYHCARCSVKGYARRAGASSRLDPAAFKRAQQKAEALDEEHRRAQRRKAQWLYAAASELTGTVAETYLREARGIQPPYPKLLRFLAPQKPAHHPALVTPFGQPREIFSGRYAIVPIAIRGVHLTLLKQDGSGKDQNEDGQSKLMIGPSSGFPLPLWPPNDLLGLAVCEGLEDALSVHAVTGLGCWASGSAGRLPALAAQIPAYIEHVRIFQDADKSGRRGACELLERLSERGIEASIVEIGGEDAA
jgi:hypothetical protein